MTEDIDRLEGAFDRLQDQYAALREDVENMIAVLQGIIKAEEE